MKKILFLWVSLWVAASVVEAYTYYGFDRSNAGKCLSTSVLQEDELGYKVRICLHGVNITEMKNDDVSFNALMFDNFYTLVNIGEPALPTVPQLIAIPKGCSVKGVNIRELHRDTMDVGNVYPYQPSYREGEKPKEFFYSENAYESPVYHSPLIVSKRIKEWKGDKFLYVNICPFKYYPSSGTASVLTEYEIDVEFMPLANGDESKGQSSSPDKNGVKSANPSEQYDLLIIAHDSFSPLTNPAIKKFCFWKACKGIRTKVVPTSLSGTNYYALNAFIEGELENGISYVLLIGDENQIPTYGKTMTLPDPNGTPTNTIIQSDYLFGVFDDVPSVAVGRFCTSSQEHLLNMVEKTIEYESTSLNVGSNKTLLMAGYQTGNNASQHCSDIIGNAYYATPFSFVKAYGGQGASNSDIASIVNNGVNIINYRGNGSEVRYEYWNTLVEDFTPAIFIDNVSPNLVNPVFFSITRKSGDINYSIYCMLKNFMKLRHSGTTAFLGSTFNTYPEQEDRLDIWLFETLLDDKEYHLGKINSIAQEQTILYSINEADSLKSMANAYSYLLGGDPTLEIWTAPAQEFNDSLLFVFDELLYTGTDDAEYNVHLISDDGELMLSMRSECGNYIELPIIGPCYVALEEHDYIPRVYYYDPVSDYIQNITFTENALYSNGPLTIGRNVTNTEPEGDVLIKSGTSLRIYNKAGVTISNGFKCEKGAYFKVTSVMKQ